MRALLLSPDKLCGLGWLQAPPSRLWGYTLHRGLASGTAPTGDEGGLPDAEASRREPLVVDNTRIIETELRFEAEKSYLAVRGHRERQGASAGKAGEGGRVGEQH